MKIKQENGAIFFDISMWDIKSVSGKKIYPDQNAKELLGLINEERMVGVIEGVILRGNFFNVKNIKTKNIREEAKKRGWKKLNPWDTVLIRKRISDEILEELALWSIAIMHAPISERILVIDRYYQGERLVARYENPASGWRQDVGFAFEI